MSNITTTSELRKYILNGQMLGGLRLDQSGSFTSLLHTPGGSANALDSAYFGAAASGSLIMAINAATALAVSSGSSNATNIASNAGNISDLASSDLILSPGAGIGAIGTYDANGGVQTLSVAVDEVLADLDALGEVGAADKMIYSDASGSFAYGDITAAGRALLDDANATAQRTTLGLGSVATLDSIDEDNMVSNSATAIPTQQSVKAYVDSQVGGADLDFQGDSGGALSIDLDSETLDIAGGTGISTAGSGNTLTVTLDAATLSASAGGGIKMSNYDGSAAVSDLSLDLVGLAALGGATVAQSDLFLLSDAGTEKSVTFSNLEDSIFGNVSSHIVIAAGGAATIQNGVVTNGMLAGSIADSNLNTISTAGKVDIGALDIDGASEMGAGLADADLFIVDDGGAGTEKSMLASRLPTYIGTKAKTFSAIQTFNSGTLLLKGTKNGGASANFVLSVAGGIFKVSLAE